MFYKLLIVAILLPGISWAQSCRSFFLGYTIFENLYPSDRDGEYEANYRRPWPLRSQEAPRSSHMDSSPGELIHTKRDWQAYRVSQNRLLIRNSKTQEEYTLRSQDPLEGFFSQDAGVWVRIQKNREEPRVQIWNFRQNRSVEFPLTHFINAEAYFESSEKVFPYPYKNILTIRYEAQGFQKDALILIDLTAGQLIIELLVDRDSPTPSAFR